MAQAEQELTRLSALLERQRRALQGIPGVVGTAVGLRDPNEPRSAVAIQVFVASPALVDQIRNQAGRLVGENNVAVIVSGGMEPFGRP
ncbi:MAG TPA: hypothetical protein VHK45_00695 [Geminicoccaceae bacterium]|jgi:hypothetical protein|nr:hypothetical protein [Geminicoccaceae bacterium]